MPMIAELLQQARSAGASFKVSGLEIVVTNVAKIPVHVRSALKLRRTEVLGHLREELRSGSSPSSMLLAAGVEVALAHDDACAALLVAEIIADAAGGPLGLDIETAARPAADGAHHVRLTKRGVSVAAQKMVRKEAALDPRRADIRLIQVYGGGARCAVFDMRKVDWSILAPLWRSRLVVHNLQFEMKFLLAEGISLVNAECTMQASGLMLGVGRRGLAAAAREYLGWEIPKDLQTSDWGENVLSREQLIYAALDAVAALHLWEKLEVDLQQSSRWDAYILQRDVIPAAVEMETAGIGVDIEALGKTISGWSDTLAVARSDWEIETGEPHPETPNQVRKWLSENLGPDELATWPLTERSTQLSIAASALERAAHLPAIRPLLEIKRLEKLLSSFGTSLRDMVSSKTGRIHANYLVAGTKSGRWSCRKPNLQQMPGDRMAPGFRAIFRAPIGRVLIGADYSQMELRAVAEISKDPALRQIYADGLDLHTITAAEMAGVDPDEVTQEQRGRAKPVNFGSIYGMGAAGLASAAWNGYRVEMTLIEAKQALAAFFRKFPRLHTWMRGHADRCQQSGRINIGVGRVLENAWESGGVRYTQCCNLPVQGACADVMMRAVAYVHRRIKTESIDAILIAQIHDEIIVEVASEHVGHVKRILNEEMVSAFVGTFPGAPVVGLVDAKVGDTWADLK